MKGLEKCPFCGGKADYYSGWGGDSREIDKRRFRKPAIKWQKIILFERGTVEPNQPEKGAKMITIEKRYGLYHIMEEDHVLCMTPREEDAERIKEALCPEMGENEIPLEDAYDVARWLSLWTLAEDTEQKRVWQAAERVIGAIHSDDVDRSRVSKVDFLEAMGINEDEFGRVLKTAREEDR